jgi:hypothetical protein
LAQVTPFARSSESESKNLLGRIVTAGVLQDSARHFNAPLLREKEKREFVLAINFAASSQPIRLREAPNKWL